MTNIRALSALLACVTLPALAAPLATDPARSTVAIVFKQMGVPVDARFKKFNAAIDYDAAKPENSRASMEIELASFDLGDPEYSKEALKKEWFDAVQFPRAAFVSTAMRASGAGKLDVRGRLSIKGRTVEVGFPLTAQKQGAGWVFEGSLPIRRLQFRIGEGEWKDTAVVADEVVIKFHVVAH